MSGLTKPITPTEAIEQRQDEIPDLVIECVNKLIKMGLNSTGRRATVSQPRLVELLVAKGLCKTDIFKNHWLDFEPVFRMAGWHVSYDKPGYNETYDASWTFKTH